MNEEKNRSNTNQVILEGNVGGIGTPFETQNGKKRMRFDLAQTRGESTQYVPIIMPTNLVDSYGQEIQKGDWLSIKGVINSFNKPTENNGKTYNSKVVEIIAMEIEDKKNNKIYTSNQTKESTEEMER